MEPVFEITNLKVQKWLEEEYEPNEKYLENLKNETINGEMVRSKSEVIIANMLSNYKDKFLYKYEKPLELIVNGEKQVFHPDFTIIDLRTGNIKYWEHAGRMDEPRYAIDYVKKMNYYLENELMVGRDVIVTYETISQPINVCNVKGYPKIVW